MDGTGTADPGRAPRVVVVTASILWLLGAFFLLIVLPLILWRVLAGPWNAAGIAAGGASGMVLAGRDLRALRPRARWTAWAGAFGYLAVYWFCCFLFVTADPQPEWVAWGAAPALVPPLLPLLAYRAEFTPAETDSDEWIERVFE